MNWPTKRYPNNWAERVAAYLELRLPVCTMLSLVVLICVFLTSCQQNQSSTRRNNWNLLSAQRQLKRFRELDSKDPKKALAEINAALDHAPQNPNLQLFRWYLAQRTGCIDEVLRRQRKDYDKLHNLWLGEFHLLCLMESENHKNLLPMADLVVRDHPKSHEARFVRSWHETNAYEFKKSLEDVESLPDDAGKIGWKTTLGALLGQSEKALKIFTDRNFSDDPEWYQAKLAFYSAQLGCADDSGRREEYVEMLRHLGKSHAGSRIDEARRITTLFANRQMWKPAFDNALQRLTLLKKTSTVPEFEQYIRDTMEIWKVLDRHDAVRKAEGKKLFAKYQNWGVLCTLGTIETTKGNLKEAKALFEASIRLNPNQWSSYYHLMGLDPGNAHLRVERCIENYPGPTEFVYLKGFYNQESNPLPSLKCMKDAYLRLPIKLAYLEGYLKLLNKIDPKADLMAEVDKLCSMRDGGPDPTLLKVRILKWQKRSNEAVAVARYATKTWTDRVQPWLALGVLLSEQGKTVDAIEAYSQGIIRTDDLRLRMERANLYLSTKQYEKVIADADHIIASIPRYDSFADLAKLYYLKGVACQNLARFEEALKCFKAGVRLDPNDTRFPYERSSCYVALARMHLNPQKENPEAAIRYLDLALADGKGQSGVLLIRSDVNDSLGRLKAARDDLTEILVRLDTAHNRSEILFKRAKLNERLGYTNAALSDCNEILKTERLDYVFARRAMIYHELGDLTQARSDLTEALRIDPYSFNYMRQRAIVCFEAGAMIEALHDLDNCLQIDNTSLSAYKLRAKVLASLGRAEQAAMDRKKANELIIKRQQSNPPIDLTL